MKEQYKWGGGMSATQELKKAIEQERFGVASRILREVKNEGLLPQSKIIMIQNYIDMTSWESTRSEAVAKLKAMVANI
jgi:hypothetical protein